MDEAIAVLREAVRRSSEGLQTGADVRLALKALRFTGIPNEALRYFWEACNYDRETGRSQSMNAALNRIELFRQGKLP
jgi:hypothetical protein